MKETLTRILSGIVYILLLITATSFSFETFLLLFGFFMLVCVVEFCTLINLNRVVPLLFATVAYTFLNLYPFSGRWIENFDMFLVMATILINIRCLMFLYNLSKKTVSRPLGYLFLIGYIIIPFILIPKIPGVGEHFNPKIIIGIFILFWTNDTFAFIIGKTIGRTKLFERISPKKTVEGFIGGLVFTMLGSILIADYYVSQPQFIWILSAIIISIFGTLGDLVESKFKRIAGVKDSGRIMPGHGGILDRLDSVIFAAPILFLLYQITFYVS